jgi:HPt (histidine-containing phosphotransfer) domain-containing protein
VGALDIETLDSLRELIGDDAVREAVTLFLTALDESMPVIVNGSRSHDREVLKATAHRLKGGARSLGAHRLGELCDELEREAPGADWPRLDALVARIQAQRTPLHDQLLVAPADAGDVAESSGERG